MGSGLVLTVLMLQKRSQLLRQVAAAEEAATGPDGVPLTVLQQRIRTLHTESEAFAQRYTSELADRTADEVLASDFGLTRDRLRKIETLSRRLGA